MLSKNPKQAVFRADASHALGSGHLFRCILLAEKLTRLGFEIKFICRFLSPHFEDQMIRYGYELIHYKKEKDVLTYLLNGQMHSSRKVLIVDAKDATLRSVQSQHKLKEKGWQLFYFVFDHTKPLIADVILNQNIRAPELDYAVPPTTIKLLGTQYVLLKDDFSRIQPPPFEDKSENLLVYFGGSDPYNRTLPVLEYVLSSDLRFDRIIVVAGKMNKEIEKLKEVCSQRPENCELHIQTNQMADLMARSKYALTAGGLGLWELAVSNVLAIALPNSERERITIEYCLKNNWVHSLFGFEQLDKDGFLAQLDIYLQDPENGEMTRRFNAEVSTDGSAQVTATINDLVDGA